jgi:hypothetical protein
MIQHGKGKEDEADKYRYSFAEGQAYSRYAGAEMVPRIVDPQERCTVVAGHSNCGAAISPAATEKPKRGVMPATHKPIASSDFEGSVDLFSIHL